VYEIWSNGDNASLLTGLGLDETLGDAAAYAAQGNIAAYYAGYPAGESGMYGAVGNAYMGGGITAGGIVRVGTSGLRPPPHPSKRRCPPYLSSALGLGFEILGHVAGDAAMGAEAGSEGGPLGAAGGTVVGGLFGIFLAAPVELATAAACGELPTTMSLQPPVR
jgi:hypothetical protein